MTYNAFEISTESSRPIELFQFELGGELFRYNTSESSLVISAATYLPEPIRRESLAQNGDRSDSTVEITVPATNEFAKRYLAKIPGVRGLATIKRVQLPDFPTPEVVTLFQGYVQSVTFSKNGREAKIAVSPSTTALNRIVPRITYQGSCNHFLYDEFCQVDSEDPDFKLTAAIVTAVNGNQITVAGASGFVDQWFQNGFVEALGGSDARVILNHVGDVLTLLLPFTFNIVGQPVNVRAGCGHIISVCASKFNNVIRYGGFAFVPSKDMFTNGFT